MDRVIETTGLRPETLAREETLFLTANGYLGVRASFEEGVPDGVKTIRGTYLNAFYDLKPIAYGEKLYGFPTEQETMVGVVDAQTIRLTVGDEVFSPFSGQLMQFSRRLDMARGLATRSMTWLSPKGRALRIQIERMASFPEPSLFVIRYAVSSVDFDGALLFESTQDGDVESYADPDDPRVAQRRHRHLKTVGVRKEDGVSVMVCQTIASGLTMASAIAHTLDGQAADALSAQITPGQTVVLEKWCAFADSRRTGDPARTAERILRGAMEKPLADWKAAQKAYLDAFWEGARVVIEGNDTLQDAVDFSLYQLLQSAGRDAISNIAAKGLSGEGYEGHYFWDTEIYIFPFFLLTNPERARLLLSYRYGILDAARAHARMMGHERGALYPWRTIAGRECSGYYPSGSAQYHINGDVAHSFAQYWHLTGDLRFMAQMGAEVLIETARLWIDAGHMREGRFRIDDVTGPDEYTCIVNNNYYTNVSARENLRAAADVCDALRGEGLLEGPQRKTGVTNAELAAFREAADAMYLPYDPALGIYAQDDSFLQKEKLDLASIPKAHFPLLLHYHPLFLYRHQVLKQADAVLAHCLYEEGVDDGDMRRTYAYYEPLTTHDSSLSPCIYGIMAARLGDMDKALSYFEATARMDLDDTHGNTADGLHTANLGGVYLGIVMGFAGLRIGKDGVSLRPRLPKGMTGYAFSFRVGESSVFCRVRAEKTTLRLLRGDPVRVCLHGVPTRVQ